MTLKELRERKNELITQSEAMLDKIAEEKRAFDEEEQKQYDALGLELDNVVNQLEQRVALREKEMRGVKDVDGKQTEDGNEQRESEEQRALELEEERAFEGLIRGESANAECRDALTNTTYGDNGAVIGTTIVNRILRKVENICPIYEGATKFHFKGTVQFPVVDESENAVVMDYASEFSDAPATTAPLTSVSLSGYLANVTCIVSRSLINNADVDIVSYVITQMAIAVKRFLEKECLIGTNNKMTGILSSANVVETAAAGIIALNDVVDLQASIPDGLQEGCAFVMHPTTRTALRKLKGDDGHYLLNWDATTGYKPMIFGKPVYVSDRMPQVAAGNRAIAYVDFSGLYVNIRENLNVQVLRELFARQHADGFTLWAEMDSKIVESQKIAILKVKSA
ncbi:MAG: phage major capsid protein [Clostridia bacterium]|nr:phage major capsid protein [Clostridia bacterium]